MKKWTLEIDNFIRSRCPCSDKHKLLQDINTTFSTSFSYNAMVSNMCVKRIQAGIKPWQNNEGKFRGRQPRPVGAESIKKNYVLVKIAQPNVWQQKNAYVWEQAHGEKVTKHDCVLFLDGNNRNFDIDNLVKVPRSIVAIVNNMRRPDDTPEILLAKIAIARLKHERVKRAEKAGLTYNCKRNNIIVSDAKANHRTAMLDPEKREVIRARAKKNARKRYEKLKEDPVAWAEYLKNQRERRRKS